MTIVRITIATEADEVLERFTVDYQPFLATTLITPENVARVVKEAIADAEFDFVLHDVKK